ncbi:hypothetical protein [Arthrobacter sp. I3]|uniref:hypothetical protein n=1 Tax=Arthrobacter sp. I3 TaxID=218158 RepID=UPI000487E3D0|nr:hypothetical protein [Arthrobacter sp. I3]
MLYTRFLDGAIEPSLISVLSHSKAVRCEDVARQTDVKAKYKLWVPQSESNTVRSMLNTCN